MPSLSMFLSIILLAASIVGASIVGFALLVDNANVRSDLADLTTRLDTCVTAYTAVYDAHDAAKELFGESMQIMVNSVSGPVGDQLAARAIPGLTDMANDYADMYEAMPGRDACVSEKEH